MRMSDWSSDVCSSDLPTRTAREALARWPPTSTLPASTACLARLRVRKNRAAQSQMSSLAVPVLTCVHDSASLQFARILARIARSEEHTSELQSLMRISYAVFCLKKKKQTKNTNNTTKMKYTNKKDRK